jgi:DNA-binding MarR family transcriptional regulator
VDHFIPLSKPCESVPCCFPGGQGSVHSRAPPCLGDIKLATYIYVPTLVGDELFPYSDRVMNKDWTDQALDRWSAVSSTLEAEPSQVIERIGRIALQLGRWQDELFSRYGLNRGEVGVLYALRGVGPPHRLSPTQLSKVLMLTSAGVTGRLDRLEQRGLVLRGPDSDDRRGVVVELTERGSQLAEQAVGAAAEAQGTLLSGLTVGEIKTLGRLLRKMQSGTQLRSAETSPLAG